MEAVPKIMMDANGGGIIDFYQRFQQLQLQRDTSDDLIKARPARPPCPSLIDCCRLFLLLTCALPLLLGPFDLF